MDKVIYVTEEQKKKAELYNRLGMESYNLEEGQKNDNYGRTRFYNGGLVECAIIESLGYDWSPFTYGSGFLNNIPDLIGLNLMLGVKSATAHFYDNIGKYDYVIKPNLNLKSDEIFCNLLLNENKIVLRGICTQEILDTYGDSSLVYGSLKDSMKNKTGFNRYDKLLEIPNDLYSSYATAITSREVNVAEGIHKNSVYIERLNEEFISYVVIDNGEISDKVMVKFPYYVAMRGQYFDNSGVLRLLDIIKEKGIIFSLGMTNIFYQLKTYNEKILKDKRYFTVDIVDVYQLVAQYNKEWARRLRYNSCLDYELCTRKNLILLLNAFKFDRNTCKIQKSFISDNCLYCLICYYLINDKLKDAK